MNFLEIAKLITYLPAVYEVVSKLIAGAKSNEDIITKIGSLAPDVAAFVKFMGETLFPQVKPELQQAAAAIAIFGRDFVKGAQMTLNIVSPLLGLPAPNLVVDGISGPKTRAATMAAQKALAERGWTDLLADGFFGFKTRDAINAFLSKVAP